MKKFISIILSVAIVMTMVFVPSASVFAAGDTDTGFSVMFNGEKVAFNADSGYSQNVNGRIMVPYRGLLVALGAKDEEITYDEATKTVDAAINGIKISFKVGSSTIDIVYADGKKGTETMDVAPFIDPSVDRTYVSTRFVSQALGYGVGWDSAKNTAVVIDWDTLLASLGNGVDNDFSTLAKLLNSGNETDLSKVYESTAKIVLDAKIASAISSQMGIGTDKDLNASLSMDMDALVKGNDLSGTMKMTLNADDLIAAVPAENQEALKLALNMLKNVNIDIIFDGETGVAYCKGDVLNLITGNTDSNTWYKMDIYEAYDSIGFDFEGMMKSLSEYTGMTPTEYVKTIMDSAEYTVDTYANADYCYSVFNSLVGNDAFKKTTSGTSTKYTLSIDKAGILAALAANESKKKSDITLLTDSDVNDFSSLDMTCSFTENGDKIVGNDISINLSGDGIEMKAAVSGNDTKSSGTISITVPEVGSFSFTIDASSTESTKTLSTLPEGAKVVDLMAATSALN